MERAVALEWQRSWDAQQKAFMPDREERFEAMLDAVEAARGRSPRVLDLACGTGSITMRLLERLPEATSVALDLDPALRRIAEATFEGDPRVRVVAADLGNPGWRDAVEGPFDAVLTATALHWLEEPRLAELYGEVRAVLADGGLFCNADHMADPDLPTLTDRLETYREGRRESAYETGAAMSWPGWWEAAGAAPELADAVEERHRIFNGVGHHDAMPTYAGHLAALRKAGFSEAGMIWRGLTDAAFAAVK